MNIIYKNIVEIITKIRNLLVKLLNIRQDHLLCSHFIIMIYDIKQIIFNNKIFNISLIIIAHGKTVGR